MVSVNYNIQKYSSLIILFALNIAEIAIHVYSIFGLVSYAKAGRVSIKPGFYHKAQPGGFYEGRFFGFYGFYVGFINLEVCHNSHNQLHLTVFLC